MNTSALLDRIKPFHIVVTCLVFVALVVSINLLSAPSAVIEIFNAAFEVFVSGIVTSIFFVMYLVAKKRQYIFTRTLMWMGIALLAWALGDALYLYHIFYSIDPFISYADLFYITATLLVISAVLFIPVSQSASRRRNMVFIEISILVLSATIIFTVFLLVPGKADLSYDPITMLMIFVYPVLDVILLWIIMIMFFTYQLRSSQKVLGLLFVGALFIFFSDLIYLTNNLYSPLIDEYFVDMGYYFFYVLYFLAGFTGFKEIRERPKGEEKVVAVYKQGNWIVFLPGVFLITVIGLLLVFVLNQSFVLFHGIVVLIALVIILFIIHQYLVIIDNMKLTREMRLINSQLEEKVLQRTSELSKTNNELQEEMKERQKVEAHLAATNLELSVVNREKDKLFTIMAHDLRSPLGSIMKLSELMVENIKDFEEDELLEVADTLSKTSKQTFLLLNDLLAWSAVQLGRGDRKKEQFSIAEIIFENLTLITAEAQAKDINVQADIDKTLVLFTDKFAIQTVVRNLISNAVKFTPQGGSVSVSAQPTGKHIKITVKDSGIGISKDKQAKLFRIDAVNSTPGTEGEKGTGFGLLLCKDLVERNGGEIGLESEKGKGSTFYFTLPVKAENETISLQPEINKAARVDSKYDHTKKLAFNIMVGDFNFDTLKTELNLIWNQNSYMRDYSALIDLRQATFNFELKRIQDVLEIFMNMPGNSLNRKFAVLTSTPQQVAYSTMIGQNVKSKYPFSVEIFSTYEAAINWIGS